MGNTESASVGLGFSLAWRCESGDCVMLGESHSSLSSVSVMYNRKT